MTLGVGTRDGMIKRQFRWAGRDATLVRHTGATGNRATGNLTPTTSSATVRVFEADFTETERAAGAVTVDHRKILVSGDSLAAASIADISTDDRLTVGSDTLGVEARRRVMAAGILQYIEVKARRARG